MLTRISATLLAVLLLGNVPDARVSEVWSYEKLCGRADVVAIVEVKSTDKWDEAFDKKLLGNFTMVGQLTTFDVKAVIKGKVGSKALQLVHYNAIPIGIVHKVGKLEIIEHYGGSPKPLDFKPVEGHYMLFLKLRKDGKFEPVSGPVDSAYSVMLLKPEQEPDELPIGK